MLSRSSRSSSSAAAAARVGGAGGARAGMKWNKKYNYLRKLTKGRKKSFFWLTEARCTKSGGWMILKRRLRPAWKLFFIRNRLLFRCEKDEDNIWHKKLIFAIFAKHAVLLPRSLKVFRERSIYPTKTLIPHKTVAGSNYLPTAKAEAMRETEVGRWHGIRSNCSLFYTLGRTDGIIFKPVNYKLQAQTTAGR